MFTSVVFSIILKASFKKKKKKKKIRLHLYLPICICMQIFCSDLILFTLLFASYLNDDLFEGF